MIDAYIIEKLKRRKEEQGQEWQPLQLPLETPDSTGDSNEKERPKPLDQGERGVSVLR